jgi:membrane protein DedA with SNARE-associated domain
MIDSFLAFLSQLEATFSTGNPSGLVILFFLAAVTDIGVPVPFVLDTILILASYHSTAGGAGPLSFPVLLIVAMLFAGRQLGSGILYLLSRFLGKKFLNWLKRHVPSIGDKLDAFKTRLSHWAVLAVTTGRLTPGLLQITSVASGTICLRYSHFVLGIAISSIVYDGILILLGFIAAHSPRSSDINFTIWVLIAMMIIVCVLWPLIFMIVRRGKKGRPVQG